MSQTATVPAAWKTHGLTVLCGAGLSMAPPASVPSWWEFNQAVLVAIRERYQRDSVVPAHARASIERPIALPTSSGKGRGACLGHRPRTSDRHRIRPSGRRFVYGPIARAD